MHPKVEQFLLKAKNWKEEMILLRDIVAGVKGLEEDCKWMHPCYTVNGKNVVLIHGFKNYCALLFFKGSLMKDPDGLLVQQTEHVQAARQLRFTSSAQILKQQSAIVRYIREAIALERSGARVEMKKTTDYPVPAEFAQQLKANKQLYAAFKALTPGRQRAYLHYFGQAKRAETRMSRIEKYLPAILEGKGLDD